MTNKIITVKLAGMEISGPLEEVHAATTRFSHTVNRDEMADIADVSTRTISRWMFRPGFPDKPIRYCDFVSFLANCSH